MRGLLSSILLFFSVLCFAVPTVEYEDVCDTDNRWTAYLYDFHKDIYYEQYTPSEFFTENGASLPDFTPGSNLVPFFEFNDVSCLTDAFEVLFEVEYLGYTDDTCQIIIWFSTEDEYKPSFLDELNSSGKSNKKPLEKAVFQIPRNSKDSKLRAGEKTAFGFKYENGRLYHLRNGITTNYKEYNICRISTLQTTWFSGGGILKSLKFTDFTNGTEYYEDFSDCHHASTYPRCPEPEPDFIEIDYQLPTCDNSDLTFSAFTSLDTVHWKGPNGFDAFGLDLTVPYDEAKSGCYYAYGRNGSCSEYVYKKVCINVPDVDIKSVRDTMDICESDSYYFIDTLLTTSGTYTRHLKSAAGCDSVSVVRLNVHKTDVQLYRELCYGYGTKFNGELLTESGVYSVTHKNELGCDSVTTLNLTVHPYIPYSYVDTSFCDYVNLYGRNFYYSTSFRIVIPSIVNGCDSTIVFRLTKIPTQYEVDDTTYFRCTEPPVLFNGYTIYGDTTVTDTVKDENNCITIYRRPAKFVLPTQPQYVNLQLCNLDDYTFSDGFVLKGEGEHDVAFTDLNGCDSLVRYIVTRKIETDYIEKIICFDEEYILKSGKIVKAAGSYIDTIRTEDGCHVKTTYDIDIAEIKTRKDTVFYCEDTDELPENYKEAFYEDDPAGCKIAVTKYHIYRKVNHTNLKFNLCDGDSAVVGDRVYKETGEYIDTLTGKNGCDSIISVSVVKHPKYYKREQVSLCDFSPYTMPSGRKVMTSGTYIDSLQTDAGCDSIIEIELERTIEQRSESKELCPGDFLSLSNGTKITTSGIFKDTTYEQGCAVVTTYDVLAYESSDVYNTEYVCTDITPLPYPKTESESLTTEGGCEMTIYTTYIYRQVKRTDIFEEICSGEKYDGRFYESGDYSDTLSTVEGCDSIVTIHLTVIPLEEKEVEETECDYEKRGKTKLSVDTVPVTGSCPMIVRTTTKYISPSYTKIDTTVCKGVSVEVGGNKFYDDNTYKVTLTAANGCDSIITLRLRTERPQTTETEVTICAGETYKTEQNEYASGGFFTETYKTAAGCDSVVTIRITKIPRQEKRLPNVQFCAAEPIKYHGKTYEVSATHIDTVMTEDGCPEYQVTKLEADPAIEAKDRVYDICKGQRQYVQAGIGISGGIYNWSPSLYLDRNDKRNTYCTPVSDVTYFVTITRGLCRATEKITVKVAEPAKILDIKVDPVERTGTVKTTGGTGTLVYSSENADYTGTSNIIKADKPGWYDVLVTDDLGCRDSSGFFYKTPIVPDKYVAPYADGDHKLWRVHGLEEYNVFTIKIFDRWGKLLEYYENTFEGWDGTHNGVRMPSTDYWYEISVDLGEYMIVGHFTLMNWTE